MALGWDTEPGCIQHGVPGSDGVYKAYQDCADFFTFGPGSTVGTVTDGVSTSYWFLTAIGFLVMLAAFVAWVRLEDQKLQSQAARLLTSGQAGQVRLDQSPPLAGPSP